MPDYPNQHQRPAKGINISCLHPGLGQHTEANPQKSMNKRRIVWMGLPKSQVFHSDSTFFRSHKTHPLTNKSHVNSKTAPHMPPNTVRSTSVTSRAITQYQLL